MNSSKTASDLIVETVTSWPRVSVEPGRRGALSLRYDTKRELAHLHGNRSAHFTFPKDLSDQLKSEGRVTDHPLGQKYRGLAARGIENDEDIEEVIALIRLNYDREVNRDASKEGSRW